MTLFEIKEKMATLQSAISADAAWIAEKAADPATPMDEITTKKAHRDELQSRFDMLKSEHDAMEAKQREHGKLAGCGDGYCPEERERKRSKSEKAGKQQHSAGKQQTHTDAERTAQTVKGHGNIEKIDHEGKAGDYHAGGRENIVCNPEGGQKLGEIQKTYAGKDAYAAGNTAAEYVFQKIAAHPFAVGFKGKHEGGDS